MLLSKPLPSLIFNHLNVFQDEFNKGPKHQSPSRVVIRYPDHTPLQWTE